MNILKDKNIKKYIFCFQQRTDGLGAQYHGYLSVMAFCDYHNLKFKHTQFYSIKKFENNVKINYSKNDMSKINIFFGFPNEEEIYEKKI